jgi:hypothetical protein
MRRLTVVLLAASFLTVCLARPAHGGDDPEPPKASGRLDGERVKFPARCVAQGVKAAVGLLESGSDRRPHP